jgi:ABC-2 type transport system permease protein
MNFGAGWMLVRRTWSSWMQSRSFFFLLAFGWMIPPLIYLFVWATAAGSQTIAGWTQGEFIGYYLVLINVNQLTYAQTNWTVGDMIRMGGLNRLLLYPMAPIFDSIAAEIAGKVVYMTFVIPVTFGLALILHPTLSPTLGQVGLFVVAVALAWGLRFFWGYALALLAFWFTRADALLTAQDALIFLIGGQVAPTVLLPEPLRSLAFVLPFRYMLGFPVEILTGQLSQQAIAFGFAMQTFWLALAVTGYRWIWQRGLRRYSAIGG